MATEFLIWSAGKDPFNGQSRFCFVSRCGRWHARTGNFGTMILTDRKTDAVHVVKGKMPEVKAEVAKLEAAYAAIAAAEGRFPG